MRWTVEGADAASGRDAKVAIEAKTAAEAEAQAKYNGLLVSKVYPAGGDPASPGHAAPRTPTPPVAGTTAPAYADIISGAKALDGLAGLARAVAVAAFAIAVVISVLPFVGQHPDGPPGRVAIATALATAMAPAGFGVLLLIVAAVLRMLGSLGLAVRDVARNSSR